LPQTLEAIADADLITIGPGSLYTSLATNLLVHGIPEAIAKSPAIKVFICNLMTQANESLGLTASDHLRILRQYAGCELFDYALVNNAQLSPELRAKYALEGAAPIIADTQAIERSGVKVIESDYLEDGNLARHASDRIAQDLMRITAAHRQRPSVSSAVR
jgi:uncharacterized cofD-like protein